jgi:hypothetical protein
MTNFHELSLLKALQKLQRVLILPKTVLTASILDESLVKEAMKKRLLPLMVV